MRLANEENLIINHKLLESFYNKGVDIYSNGEIYRYSQKLDEWLLVPNNDNCNGYNEIKINNKRYYRHRLISACYKGLKLKYNKQNLVDHLDRNKLNNNSDNLRIVTYSQNQQNKESKSYYYDKQRNKFRVKLYMNGKQIYLGLFKTEEEARTHAIKMKIKYYKSYNHLE